ncbi:MAG: endonuclease [Bacilli bacterium]|nr:endonuclease [Bacilli bacterium]
MKNKKILTILTAIAFIVSGCTGNTQSSSIAPSTPSTTSEVSSNPSSDTSTSTTSSADSTSATSSNTSTSATTSSSVVSSSSSAPSSSSSSTTSSSYIPSGDTTWNINISLRGAEFRNALQTIMAGKRTRTTSYSNCLSLGAKAAAYPNANSSTFVPFYHDSHKTATQSECNREHTWPNSRGTGTSGPGADPFIIRPTLTSENSDRGNNFYGTKGKANKEWDPASCGFEAARGESARVILYAATMYYREGLSLSNNPNDSTNLKTMGTLSTLLAWNTTYAPTPIEIQINNYLSSNGYGRNPFVDHPEYASYIWNNNGLIGGEIPPDPGDFTNGLDRESSLANLDGNNYVIASSDSATSFSYFAMDNEAKSSTLPWYIKPIGCSVNDDKTKLIANDGATLKYYKFIKQTDGNYYIQNKENGKYIFAYYDGSHYSIGLGTTPTNSGSLSWTITTSNNGFVMKNATNSTNVYLEYYNGSFCGYKSAPSVPIYLYH